MGDCEFGERHVGVAFFRAAFISRNRRGKRGAEVLKTTLDHEQLVAKPGNGEFWFGGASLIEMGDCESNVRGQFVDAAEGVEYGVGFGATFAGEERRCALVTGASVNFRTTDWDRCDDVPTKRPICWFKKRVASVVHIKSNK